MTIRFAGETDIPAMITLLRQVGEVHHKIRPDLFRCGAQKYDETALKRLISDEKRPIFLAEAEGKVAGYCFCILQTTREDAVLCDRKVLYIDDLCVEESLRGQGIAGALYRHVCGYARKIGCHAVTLNVWTGNDSAMRFYKKMGMKPQKVGMEMILEESGC